MANGMKCCYPLEQNLLIWYTNLFQPTHKLHSMQRMQNRNAHIATSIDHDSYLRLRGPLLGALGHRNAIELDPLTPYTLGPVAMWKWRTKHLEFCALERGMRPKKNTPFSAFTLDKERVTFAELRSEPKVDQLRPFAR